MLDQSALLETVLVAIPSRKGYVADDLTPEQEQEILSLCRKRFDYATEAWSEIRTEGQKDMLCVAGKVWDAMDPAGKGQRGDAKRPMLSLDELGQYTNQLVNKVRANPRGVKFSPTGNGASEKTAEFYQNKTREIEYRSHSQMVYTTAFENAVQRSYGFCKVVTKYAGPKSFNQDIWLEPIVNPDLVTPDPDALRPDGSDMKYCFVHELWDVEAFKAAFPDAKQVDFEGELAQSYPQWIRGEKLLLAEYWVVKTKRRVLVELKPPAEGMAPLTMFEDELKAQGIKLNEAPVSNRREVEDQEVCQYLTNGIEILKITKWLGKYIPIASCFGKVLFINEGGITKKKIMSLVRLARDPLMLYCYYRTTQAELVGMTPKTPYFVYEGQIDEQNALLIAKSLHEPVPYIQAKATIEGLPQNQALPLPQRQPYIPEIERLEIGAEGARRAIQAAMGGAPLPSSAQRRNEKSGKALQKIEESYQLGNFHYEDHYDDMIKHVGVIVEDLMDKIYDSARQVAVLEKDDTPKTVQINDGSKPDAISTKGEHLVTISAGPSFDSQREAASDFADTLAQIPEVFMRTADLIVKLKNLGPIGDALADRLTPPEYRQMKEGEQDPQALMMQLSEAKKALEALTQSAQNMKQALETEQAKQQAQIQKAHIDAQKAVTLEKMKAATTIATAKINAASKLEDTERQGVIDAALLEMEQRFEAVQAELERDHQEDMAEHQTHRLLAGQAQKAVMQPQGSVS